MKHKISAKARSRRCACFPTSTSTNPFLQTVLVGQPQLKETLLEAGTIAVCPTRILGFPSQALGNDEVGEYIGFRLAPRAPVFTCSHTKPASCCGRRSRHSARDQYFLRYGPRLRIFGRGGTNHSPIDGGGYRGQTQFWYFSGKRANGKGLKCLALHPSTRAFRRGGSIAA